jgi:hypothetical protein
MGNGRRVNMSARWVPGRQWEPPAGRRRRTLCCHSRRVLAVSSSARCMVLRWWCTWMGLLCMCSKGVAHARGSTQPINYGADALVYDSLPRRTLVSVQWHRRGAPLAWASSCPFDSPHGSIAWTLCSLLPWTVSCCLQGVVAPLRSHHSAACGTASLSCQLPSV